MHTTVWLNTCKWSTTRQKKKKKSHFI